MLCLCLCFLSKYLSNRTEILHTYMEVNVVISHGFGFLRSGGFGKRGYKPKIYFIEFLGLERAINFIFEVFQLILIKKL